MQFVVVVKISYITMSCTVQKFCLSFCQ